VNRPCRLLVLATLLGLGAGCAGAPPRPRPGPVSPPRAAPAPAPTTRVEAVPEKNSPAPAPAPTPPAKAEPKPGAAKAGAESGAAKPPAPPKPPSGSSDDPEAKRAFAAGVAAAGRDDLAAAESAFSAAVARDPAFGWAWFDLGVTRERKKDDDGAAQAYRSALAQLPGFHPAADGLARLLVRTGRAAEAERELRALADRKDGQGARAALAWTLLARKRTGDAEAEAKRMLKEDERNAPAMAVLAQVYFDQRKLELARMVLETARRIDPADASIVFQLAMVKLELEDEEGAFADLQEAARRPDFALAQLNYGAMLVKREHYEEAIPFLERSVRLAPEVATGHLALGNAYRGTRRFDRALAEYQQALRQGPKLPEVHFALALLYLDGDLPGTTIQGRL
jgi:tetratricopeptide (TPR) repeat protein